MCADVQQSDPHLDILSVELIIPFRFLPTMRVHWNKDVEFR